MSGVGGIVSKMSGVGGMIPSVRARLASVRNPYKQQRPLPPPPHAVLLGAGAASRKQQHQSQHPVALMAGIAPEETSDDDEDDDDDDDWEQPDYGTNDESAATKAPEKTAKVGGNGGENGGRGGGVPTNMAAVSNNEKVGRGRRGSTIRSRQMGKMMRNHSQQHEQHQQRELQWLCKVGKIKRAEYKNVLRNAKALQGLDITFFRNIFRVLDSNNE